MTYRRFRIGEVCSLIKGTSPTMKTDPGEYPLVVTAAFRRTASTYQLEGPAVCVPLVSSTGHGDAALHRVHYQDGRFALANLLVALLPKDPNLCEAKYLYHLLMAKKEEYLVPLMLGTANVSLKIEDIAGVEIPLPPLAEQRRIVARIEQLVGRIEEARRLRHQATEEAEALLPSVRSACMGELLKKHSGEPLGELISMASGEGLTSSEMDDSFEYPVYGGGGLNGRYSRYLFEESRIAIGRVGARCGCVFTTEPKSWITDNALYLTETSDRLDHKFLVHALSNLDLRQQANQAAQPVVSQKKINPMEIPVPPLPEQRRIVEYLDRLAGQVTALTQLQSETAAELGALLPSILDRAFKGKL